ncbi:MAG: FAD-binding protein [Candidatus Korobacteraceae bacterium]
MTSSDVATYQQRRERLIRELAAARAAGASVGLAKTTSNLFRHRQQTGTKRIDVRAFHHVLDVDAERRIADIEGMTTYEELADETLKFGLLPTVVPQLKTITIGGAISGIGIESSSFKYGLVHETVEEMEILLADGSTIVCSSTQNPDLFYGFPNSYGTLGYVLRLKVKLIPAKRYVKLTHTEFSEPAKFFAQIEMLCSSPGFDYIDGVVFGGSEVHITTGEFTDEAPFVSDYTYMKVFYKSIRQRSVDYLTAHDYIWRWDTDWFWCSKHFYVQHALVRLLATRRLLNSKTYQRIMRLAHKVLPESQTESVIQDVDIPIEHAVEFLQFLLREIGVLPIWICPFRSYDPSVTYDLYALDPKKLYINFGFWDTVPSTQSDGYYNKKIEAKALALRGVKGLYSTACYDEETFWQIYNRPSYEALKNKYDPGRRFRDLYEKTVKKM